MTNEVKWLKDGIFLFSLHPPFISPKLNQALDDSIEMVNATRNQTVGTVLDVQGIMHVPPGSIKRDMKLLTRKPPNTGPGVLVKAHPAVKAFCGMARMIHPPIGNLIHFADDRAGGVAVLRRVLKTYV